MSYIYPLTRRSPKRVRDDNAKLARNVQIAERKERLAGRPIPNACEICLDPDKPLNFDHCHKTGRFRGWICRNCNLALGFVKDEPAHLRLLIEYLERSP